MMHHTVETTKRVYVPNEAFDEVLIYRFDDGSVWTQASEWFRNKSGAWRAGKTTYSRKEQGETTSRKSTSTAFYKKLSSSTKREA